MSIVANTLNSREFGYVILAGTGIVAQYLSTEMLVMKERSRVFGKEWAQSAATKTLRKEHAEATGDSELPRGGYPDMGNGRFAATLSHKQWYDFNVAQRVHYNTLEQMPIVLPLLAASGIFYPKLAASFGGLYIAGRTAYIIGYRKHGPRGREVGAIIAVIATLGLLGTTLTGAVKHAGLLSFLTKRA